MMIHCGCHECNGCKNAVTIVRNSYLAITPHVSLKELHKVVADTLLKIHDAAPGFRGERGLKTWVLRIVANRCRDLLRRRRFDAGKADEMDPIAHSGLRVDPGEGWDDALDKPALFEALERAIDELPAEQREAVIMKERLGLSVLETAEALNISESAVKSRLFRARAVLLEKLRGWESDRPR
jgi:RNA polymerase sigma-70 factor (ECF subfamily)